MKFDTILNKALKKYGKERQLLKVIEETTELNKELLININKHSKNRIQIVEELADVELTLFYVYKIFEILPHEVDEIKKYKLKKLEIDLLGGR